VGSGDNQFEESFAELPRPVSISTNQLEPGSYEVRVVKLSGDGTPAISNVERLTGVPIATVSGKTTSRYQRSYRLTLSGPPPWDIRVRRLTPDSTTAALNNQTWWDSYTEIIDAKLRYPNSALVGLQIDSSQFQNIPQRGYDMKLLRVKVPSNYNPVTRAYTGNWNGTFQIAWTDNPAWCFYDLLTNPRYGLGEFIPEAQVDKWALYTIAQYCDQLVPNGFGGTEPRFTCNIYIQSRAEAYRVVNDMASIFRAMVFWASGAITAVQDSPADAAYLYAPANVVDGLFTYSGSSRRVRHTVALVTWNDPSDLYRQKVEYVDDPQGIALYGIVQTEVQAVGCTSRGQAHRVGKWLLLSERLESDVVTFRVGMDGAIARPGQIIKVADPGRAGVRLGGRILAATTTAVTLDSSVTLAPATTYTLAVIDQNADVVERTVTTAAGTVSALTVSPAFAVAPDPMAVWVLSSTAVLPQTFRVISVTEEERNIYSINALAQDPSKYAAIEQGLLLEPRSISTISSRPPPPTAGTIGEYLYEAATDLKTMVDLAWTPSGDPSTTRYAVSYRRDSGNFVDLPETSAPSVQIPDALPGQYTIRVLAINSLGLRSMPLEYIGTVLGKTAPPSGVTGLQIQVQGGSALLSWDTHPDLDVRLGGRIVIRHSTAVTGASWSSSVPMAEFSGAATSGTVPLLSGTYLAKAVDTSDSFSLSAVGVSTTIPALQQFNVLATTTEDPTFSGAKIDMEVAAGRLQLGQLFLWDDIPDFDALLDPIDSGIKQRGEYAFTAPIDIGSVFSCRVTADIGVLSFDLNNIVDQWVSLDSVSNIDGVLGDDSAQVRLYISTTPDDPNGSPVWSDWRLFSVGDYAARGFRFRLEVARGPAASQQVAITALSVTVDVPDRVEGDDNVAVPSGGLAITYANEFFAVPAVAISAENMATGDYYTITAKTTAGFTIQFKNSAGTGVARTMDWIAKGYGYKG
jgi:predicted phage tail protein